MNEQLIHALEAAQQLPDVVQSAIAARILQEIEEYQGFGGSETLEEQAQDTTSRPLTGREFVEKLYREGKVLNIPTWKPLTEEEKAKRAQLAQAAAGGKSLSEIVIEGRGPY